MGLGDCWVDTVSNATPLLLYIHYSQRQKEVAGSGEYTLIAVACSCSAVDLTSNCTYPLHSSRTYTRTKMALDHHHFLREYYRTGLIFCRRKKER
jgi:hypothetical protein